MLDEANEKIAEHEQTIENLKNFAKEKDDAIREAAKRETLLRTQVQTLAATAAKRRQNRSSDHSEQSEGKDSKRVRPPSRKVRNIKVASMDRDKSSQHHSQDSNEVDHAKLKATEIT